MLKLMLEEQTELLNRPQTVREWWEYQEAFGFDDYKHPTIRSQKNERQGQVSAP
jgi:hypothetical protein